MNNVTVDSLHTYVCDPKRDATDLDRELVIALSSLEASEHLGSDCHASTAPIFTQNFIWFAVGLVVWFGLQLLLIMGS